MEFDGNNKADEILYHRLFWLITTIHVLCWTVVPTFTSPNAPLDVIEGYAWGREWLIGTYKHPPMQAWILEIFAILTGRASWAHFLASQLAVAIAFWAVWKTAMRITEVRTALIGVLLLEGAVYYNFTTPEFNPNVLQLPFWALACLSFHRAVSDDKWLDWAFFGLWIAAGFYTKYSMALLMAVLFGFLFLNGQARQRLKSPGLYFSLLLSFLLLLPHIVWLVNNNFQPFTYAGNRAEPTVGVLQRLLQPLGFLAAQALSLLAALILTVLLLGKRPKKISFSSTGINSFDRAFLHAITFGPVSILVLLSVLFGFRPRDMWGACLWNFIGVWLAMFVTQDIDHNAVRRFAFGWVSVFVLGLTAITFSNLFYPYIKGKPLRVHFPGKTLAQNIAEVWNAKFGGRKLRYVVGDTWLAGNAAYYMTGVKTWERPSISIVSPAYASPWAAEEDIKKKGGVILWCIGKCEYSLDLEQLPLQLREKYPHAEVQKPLIIENQTKAPLKPVVIGWAILPPQLD